MDAAERCIMDVVIWYLPVCRLALPWMQDKAMKHNALCKSKILGRGA